MKIERSPHGAPLLIAPRSAGLESLVSEIAESAGCPVRPLLLQALLQLPRIADSTGFADRGAAATLVEELAAELPPLLEWRLPRNASSPKQLRFDSVSNSVTREILEKFHYLRSPRSDGRSYGLFSEDALTPLAVCVSSPLDVPHLRHLADTQDFSANVRVVARVFAFDGTPRNSISHLLALAEREEANRWGVEGLLTYVNPNMGFTGASYLATNWRLVGDEPGTTYRYLDGRYITDRQLHARFELDSDEGLRSLLGTRFAKSTMRLDPLLVFGYRSRAPMEHARRKNRLVIW